MRRLIQNTKWRRLEQFTPPVDRGRDGDRRMAAALIRGVIAKARAAGRKPTAAEVVRQVRKLLDESGRKLTQDDLSRLVAAALNPESAR